MNEKWELQRRSEVTMERPSLPQQAGRAYATCSQPRQRQSDAEHQLQEARTLLTRVGVLEAGGWPWWTPCETDEQFTERQERAVLCSTTG